MGSKASIITVKEPNKAISDELLLKRLGFGALQYSGDTTFEECIYPGDKSTNLGNYNDCLIISEAYQLMTILEVSHTPHLLFDYERVLTELYPDAEILTTACHGSVNYHVYSLVKSGRKLRFKKVMDGAAVVEYGVRLEEEEKIYVHSKIVDGRLMFKTPSNSREVYEYEEHQLMEEFTFGVAKRHLGVTIYTDEAEEFMFKTPFKKYTR